MREAMFYLAESLYLGKNPAAARGWYETLAKDGLDAPFARDAAVRLIQVESEAGDDAAVDADYRRYIAPAGASAGGPVEPSVAYALAKSYWHRGDLAKADGLFSRFDADGEKGRQARYFRAVILLKQGDRAGAETSFRELAALAPKNEEQQAVADQSFLALARLLQDRGVYREAAAEYDKVSDGSPAKADALYEQSWALLKAGRYREASDDLDLFLVSFPDHPLIPRVKLLKGRALLALDQDDEAHEAYKGFLAEYAPVPARLQQLLGAHHDPKSFLAAIDAAEGERGMSRGLPRPAVDAALARPAVKRAVALATALHQDRTSLADGRALVPVLSDALSRAAIAGLPDANERRRRAWALEIAEARARFAILKDGAEPKARDRAAAALDAVPKAFDAEEKAQAAARAQIASVRVRAIQQLDAIQQARAQAVALAKYAQDTGGADPEISKAAAGVEAELAELGARQAEIGRLLEELRHRDAESWTGRLSAGEAAARTELASAMDALEASAHPGPEDAPRLARLATVRQTLAGALGTIDRTEGARLADAHKVLDVESRALLAENDALDGAGDQAEAVAADDLRLGLAAVAASFDELVLRADLGSLDVAWLRKDRESRKIDALAAERKAALDDLAKRFAPVLDEETVP
jgi:TolA-binding protein